MSMSKDFGICTVGYALNPKKLRPKTPNPSGTLEWNGGGISDIVDNSCENDTIRFVEWKADIPLQQQPHFDVIIHKLTEDIDRVESTTKMIALTSYLALHPTTILVDSIDNVRKVTSRARTCKHLENIRDSLGVNCPFQQPNYILVDKSRMSNKDILAELKIKGLSFPIICKSVQACGTVDSHLMVVIVSAKDIDMVLDTCVVQQYYDHDANFFKVYVMDEEVMVFRRASLPNLNANPPSSSVKSVHGAAMTSDDKSPPYKRNCESDTHLFCSVRFDSRLNYPTLEQFLSQVHRSIPKVTHDAVAQAAVHQSSNRQDGDTSWKTSRSNSLTSPPNASHRKRYTICRDDSSRISFIGDGNGSDCSPMCISSTTGDDDTTSSCCLDTAVTFLSEPSADVEPVDDDDFAIETGETEGDRAESLEQQQISAFMPQFRAAADAIRQEFGLSLFGFDVIIPLPTENNADIAHHSVGMAESVAPFVLSRDCSVASSTSSTVPTAVCGEDSASPSSEMKLSCETKSRNCSTTAVGLSASVEVAHKQQQQIVVIDVNYFPSYKEVTDFPARLRTLLRNKVHHAASNSNSAILHQTAKATAATTTCDEMT